MYRSAKIVRRLPVIAGLLLALAAPAVAQGRQLAVEPRELLGKAASWGYQLQNINAAALARTPYDVLVLDTNLAAADVQRLKRKPDGTRRLVLAYINIGEAEDYRPYWKAAWAKSPPAWLGSSNERWKGDHRVRHWHPDWRTIIFGTKTSVVARLIAAGFDGAYLDRVDIYQFWCGERPTAFEDMVAFVEDLSRWAKAERPGFLILPQNGEELLQDARYRAAIDGLGKEDFLYGDRGNEVANYPTRVERAEELMGHAHRAGLKVLAIEYAREPENQRLAREHHGRLGHVLYFGPRSLGYMGQNGPRLKEDGDSEPYYALRGSLGCGDRS